MQPLNTLNNLPMTSKGELCLTSIESILFQVCLKKIISNIMDGKEICSKMKRRGRQVPGIIFSANVSKKITEPIGLILVT